MRRAGQVGRPSMRPTQRFSIALGTLTALVVIGVLGYVTLEGLGFEDALYLTIVTLTTIGYGDVVPHTTAGRVFTMALILVGLGNVFYIASVAAEMVIEGHLRDVLGRNAMQRRINGLRDHVIVCGYGRFGRVVADEIRKNDSPLVVIDVDPAREEELKRAGVPYLIGSALDDDVLAQAGLDRAAAIVVATPSDPDNVFITLSIREKSQTIRIHARGESDAALRRLELAGANQAMTAYHSGGRRMAASILRPTVVDFLELSLPGHKQDVALEEVHVGGGSKLIGRTIAQIEEGCARLRVVGVRRGEDEMRVVPETSTAIAADDLLVVIGAGDSLRQLAADAAG
jgi:voltage-gated potassium channel